MSCEAMSEEQLSAYFDAELDEDEAQRVDAHLRQCPSCQADFDRMREIRALLVSMPGPSPFETERVRQSLHRGLMHEAAKMRQRRRRFSWVPWAGGAVAAMLLFAISIAAGLPLELQGYMSSDRSGAGSGSVALTAFEDPPHAGAGAAGDRSSREEASDASGPSEIMAVPESLNDTAPEAADRTLAQTFPGDGGSNADSQIRMFAAPEVNVGPMTFLDDGREDANPSGRQQKQGSSPMPALRVEYEVGRDMVQVIEELRSATETWGAEVEFVEMNAEQSEAMVRLRLQKGGLPEWARTMLEEEMVDEGGWKGLVVELRLSQR